MYKKYNYFCKCTFEDHEPVITVQLNCFQSTIILKHEIKMIIYFIKQNTWKYDVGLSVFLYWWPFWVEWLTELVHKIGPSHNEARTVERIE